MTGRRLQPDGQASPILRNRIKVAVELVKGLEAKEAGSTIYLIVTGGRNIANKESKSEASGKILFRLSHIRSLANALNEKL